jgi:hypothetical protein
VVQFEVAFVQHMSLCLKQQSKTHNTVRTQCWLPRPPQGTRRIASTHLQCQCRCKVPELSASASAIQDMTQKLDAPKKKHLEMSSTSRGSLRMTQFVVRGVFIATKSNTQLSVKNQALQSVASRSLLLPSSLEHLPYSILPLQNSSSVLRNHPQ